MVNFRCFKYTISGCDVRDIRISFIKMEYLPITQLSSEFVKHKIMKKMFHIFSQ